MATRTQYIAQDVLRIINDQAQRSVPRAAVVRIIGQVQEDLCREGLALPIFGEITTEAGVGQYDLNGILYKVGKFYPPASWLDGLQIIHNKDVWARIKTEETSTRYPKYGHVWNKYLLLWPVPAVSGETVQYDGYGYPDAALVETTDPQISREWDEALKYGAVYRLAPDIRDANGLGYDLKYEAEVRKLKSQSKGTMDGPLQRDSSSEKLGF